MAAVAITQPLRGNRLQRLAVEREMTHLALGGAAARERRARKRRRCSSEARGGQLHQCARRSWRNSSRPETRS